MGCFMYLTWNDFRLASTGPTIRAEREADQSTRPAGSEYRMGLFV
jgi:hypothetical protein